MKIVVIAGEAELPKEFDLEQATRAVMFEEAHGFIFSDSVIKKRGKEEFNAVSFEDYTDGPYPRDCVIRKADAPEPPGFSQQKAVKMILKEGKIDVVVYRKDP